MVYLVQLNDGKHLLTKLNWCEYTSYIIQAALEQNKVRSGKQSGYRRQRRFLLGIQFTMVAIQRGIAAMLRFYDDSATHYDLNNAHRRKQTHRTHKRSVCYGSHAHLCELLFYGGETNRGNGIWSVVKSGDNLWFVEWVSVEVNCLLIGGLCFIGLNFLYRGKALIWWSLH